MTEADRVICGHCGGTLPYEAAYQAVVCPFCGTTAAPKPRVVEVERVVVQAAPGTRGLCPRCAESLRETLVNDVAFRACERCGGLWLDNATVDRLSKARDQDVEDAARRAIGIVMHRIDCTPRVGCPECSKTMVRKEIPETIHYLDTCPEHGTWFDYRELPMFVQVFADRRAGEITEDDLQAAGVERGFFSDLFARITGANRS